MLEEHRNCVFVSTLLFLSKLKTNTPSSDEIKEKKQKDPSKVRRFVIVEGLYANYGDVVPLPALVELKKKFCLYLIVDESHSFGLLGKTGGGVCEVTRSLSLSLSRVLHSHLFFLVVQLFNVPREDVDIATGSLGNIACSVGGFCSGSNAVVTHQRLNGSGYVFSASLPPYLSAVAMVALKRIKEDTVILVLFVVCEGLFSSSLVSFRRNDAP